MAETKVGAFNPKVVFAMIFLGALAFLATLYLIGTGDTGGDANNGGAHGSGKGLNGYAALASMLEEEGRDVSFSRSQRKIDGAGLLILTPAFSADPVELTNIISNRRFIGPTMVIVPKWRTSRAWQDGGSEVPDGWVELLRSNVPEWAAELGDGFDLALSDEVAAQKSQQNWAGLSQSGTLPDPRYSAVKKDELLPLVVNGGGDVLVGYIDKGDPYFLADEAANAVNEVYDDVYDDAYADEYVDDDSGAWPVTFVIEPDLVNNYGFADRNRAELASSLVDRAMDGQELPVVFDLTQNGFGTSQNLLTLAFTPPFLAATLCLILAMIVVAWRAFRRFGPAVAEGRSIAFGKAQLVKNSAGFVQNSGRLHLLSGPYAEMIRERIVKALALKNPDDEAIDTALARRVPDAEPFSISANNLRDARSPKDILRSAAALKTIERMLSK